jgi:ribosome-associated protein
MSATTSKADSQKRPSSSQRASELRIGDRAARGNLSRGGVVLDTNVHREDEGREIASLVAAAALAKKAENVQIIDVTGKVDYADFLVLMTGTSDRHVAAIAQSVEAELGQQGVRSLALEGLPLAHWVLIDFVDVVVHVFQAEWREIYDLDSLWMDASRVSLPEPPESTRG